VVGVVVGGVLLGGVVVGVTVGDVRLGCGAEVPGTGDPAAGGAPGTTGADPGAGADDVAAAAGIDGAIEALVHPIGTCGMEGSTTVGCR
jgi:hypothetical protein